MPYVDNVPYYGEITMTIRRQIPTGRMVKRSVPVKITVKRKPVPILPSVVKTVNGVKRRIRYGDGLIQ